MIFEAIDRLRLLLDPENAVDFADDLFEFLCGVFCSTFPAALVLEARSLLRNRRRIRRQRSDSSEIRRVICEKLAIRSR
jgi:hypothetical protein